MTKRPWANSEITLLRKLAGSLTKEQMAARLGRSRSSVAGKAGKLGIRFRKYGDACHRTKLPRARIGELLALRAGGWTYTQIAAHFGLGHAQIWKIINLGSRYRETLPLVLGAVSR